MSPRDQISIRDFELHDGREDIFFDSFDFLETSLDSEPSTSYLDEKISNEFWATELSAVHERCQKFLRETGFDKLFSTETGCPEEPKVGTNVSLQQMEIPVHSGEDHSISMKTEGTETTMLAELGSNRTCKPGGVHTDKAVKGNTNRRKRWWASLSTKKKVSSHDSTEITGFRMVQEIAAHKGLIRTMKLSPCGMYLATGGEDSVVRVWKVRELDDLNVEGVPLHEYFGHTSDILDLSWSRSKYLLSTSKDKTVRMWKIGCKSCVKVFYHNDYVTCIQFHPLDDAYFITGSVDRKVRIWSVDENIVVDWVDTRNIITAISYQADGKGFAVGTLSGNCLFYVCSGTSATSTNLSSPAMADLELDRQLYVWGKSKSPGKQITGLQFCPGDSDRIMITSLDSKVRIFDGSKIVQKFGGTWKSRKNHATASFTADGRHIVSVGEKSNICIREYCSSMGIRFKKATKAEHFFSEGVTVAVPWVTASHESNTPSNSIPLAKCRNRSLFSLGSCLRSSASGAASASATWPEEKLAAVTEHCLAVATGGCDGMVRLFSSRRLPQIV
ncbi:WD repeat-containing protein 44-like [Zingiber officinale]|uniref:WD repeat-containing protein 44-like n=1 Tax=Zingiber officinale TaxID=94328 RepID=UPI001C4D9E8C|nr:WD repeat-containing protein 44-like [Zingiber officinale]XP_042455216.1 WD repeat-containing protein 44-like [Zingiber officinale]